MDLGAKIEAILFWKAEPLSVGELARASGAKVDEIGAAIALLEAKLADRGLALVRHGESVELGTNPAVGNLIEQLTKEEFNRDLGKASLETLTIILYRGEATRAEIDYIRGVDSRYILRHLTIRGLIEKETNQNDARGFIYRPTLDLLGHLGVTKVEELPDYQNLKEQLNELEPAPVESSV